MFRKKKDPETKDLKALAKSYIKTLEKAKVLPSNSREM
jgi:hypothetical protein